MANRRNGKNRKNRNVYLSEEAIKQYDELRTKGYRVSLMIEKFIINAAIQDDPSKYFEIRDFM
jgi:hypothetical protein